MAKIKPITISNWDKGIGDSAHAGFGDMRNIDIYSVPGVAQINRILVKESSTTVTAMPTWAAIDQSGNIYVVDSSHKLYVSTDTGDSWSLVAHTGASTGNGNGLVIWKDYLFLIGDTKIDVYGSLAGSPTWSDAWQTITSDTSFHPALVSQDDAIYIGAGRYVASIIETAGQNFAPGTGATFTFNGTALDLPEDYRIKSISENDTWLMLGTWKGTTLGTFNTADLFKWDRTSASFDNIVQILEAGCNAMINKDNDIIMFAGTSGEIYGLNGDFAELLRVIPNNITGGAWLQVYPDAVENFSGRLLFGTSVGSTSSGFTHGIFSLGTRKDETPLALAHEYTISTGTNTEVSIGLIKQVSNSRTIVGWKDASVFGLDLLSATNVVTSYGAFVDSPFYNIGTDLKKGVISLVEIILAKDLASNEGIRIKYRTSLDDDWTTLGTFDFTTYGATNTGRFGLSVIAENIQLKIELTGTTTSPQLKTINIL